MDDEPTNFQGFLEDVKKFYFGDTDNVEKLQLKPFNFVPEPEESFSNQAEEYWRIKIQQEEAAEKKLQQSIQRDISMSKTLPNPNVKTKRRFEGKKEDKGNKKQDRSDVINNDDEEEDEAQNLDITKKLVKVGNTEKAVLTRLTKKKN